MAVKVSYSEIMTRMHGDINYIAEEAYRDGYDHCEKEMKEKVDEAYQRGLEDGKAQAERGCEGCKYEDCTSGREPCFRCARNANDYWTAKQTDDRIEVGDEVIYNEHRFIVFATETKEQYASLFDVNGRHASASQKECKKTGRHFDIDKILEEMRA